MKIDLMKIDLTIQILTQLSNPFINQSVGRRSM